MILSRPAFAAAPLLAALALAGCNTMGSAPVQVTRFHLAQPIAPGSFTVTATPAQGPGFPTAPDSLELKSYADAVAAELTRLGFTAAADPSTAEIAVSVIVDRGSRPDPRPHGASVGFGIGGGSFGGGGYRHRSGVGVGGDIGTTVPIGGNQPHYLVGTRMQVQIKRRSDGSTVWEGRAMTEAAGNRPDASPLAAVQKLAHALFLGFPGESGRTVTVKG
ncbi:MAG TPA: DUF4136 domain-containing protein [Sphingomonas sp.]